jgi:tRNA dimethylallyltransferase
VSQPRVWLIAGPTGGGKSALALRLALAVGGEIVNADSMQLYADLRILTARPSAEDAARAPHHLFGVADAGETWSAGRWLAAARDVLGDIAGRGRTAIVVGGTGLYFRALTRGLADIPPVPAAIRQETAAMFDALGEAAFRERLASVDAAAAARIGPGDRQRLTRAREVFAATGRPLSDWQRDGPGALGGAAWRGAILSPSRAELYRRCDARLAAMIETGALDEVAHLMARGLDAGLPAMKALGVAPLAALLRGEMSQDQAVARAQQETRHYVKRQITWFRHQTPDWPRVEGVVTDVQWRELGEVPCAPSVTAREGAAPPPPRSGAGED